MVVHEQNSGFSLIELLVAIAILSMLTVPLMNSFIMSGKINRNSRRLQDAAAVAQSVMETAKHTTDKAALEAALKLMMRVRYILSSLTVLMVRSFALMLISRLR